jgi:uncharacterized protein (DUF1800 family)
MKEEQAKLSGKNSIEGIRINQLFGDRAIRSEDQLRQRMVFALSQIIVVSNISTILPHPIVMGRYVDILSNNAFGNYRQLLNDITYSPAMALYLTYMNNDKSNTKTGQLPDENYAREIMQLFSIGLVELNMDGSEKTDPQGNSIATYNKKDIVGLSRVFTGLGLSTPNGHEGWYNLFEGGCEISPNCAQFHKPLIVYPKHHSALKKEFLGKIIPENTTSQKSIQIALDTLFNHSNLPPFIAKQLIQRFVTSNPTPDYIKRIANVFVKGEYKLPDGTLIGESKRGDLKATIAAILLDKNAIRPLSNIPPSFGKIREPYIRFINWIKAFKALKMSMQFVWLNEPRLGLRQTPFRSLSVFNFFRPGYVSAGSEALKNNLVAPEMQLTDESSVIDYLNFMNRYIYEHTNGDHLDPEGNIIEAIVADYTPQIALSNNAKALVEHLNLLLTGNELSSITQQQILAVLKTIPVEGEGANRLYSQKLRVSSAISMIMGSAEFLVQR